MPSTSAPPPASPASAPVTLSGAVHAKAPSTTSTARPTPGSPAGSRATAQASTSSACRKAWMRLSETEASSRLEMAAGIMASGKRRRLNRAIAVNVAAGGGGPPWSIVYIAKVASMTSSGSAVHSTALACWSSMYDRSCRSSSSLTAASRRRKSSSQPLSLRSRMAPRASPVRLTRSSLIFMSDACMAFERRAMKALTGRSATMTASPPSAEAPTTPYSRLRQMVICQGPLNSIMP